MPPKRKASVVVKEGAAKKPKKAEVIQRTTGKKKTVPADLRQQESPLPTREDGDDEKHQVPWAQPTRSIKDNSRDQGEAITRYSQALYDRPWTEIWTSEQPFKFPSIRTPVYKRDIGNDLTQKNNPHTSTSFRRVFNLIKHGVQRGVRNPSYQRRAIIQAFDDTENTAAVVVFEATQNPVLVLDRDYRVDVTVGAGDELETAHLCILRRSPVAGEAESAGYEYGYFIQLPPGTNVTVNGTTYIHERDENMAHSPFMIGPLNTYTIIELLSQPIFFFRTQDDVDLTQVLGKAAKNKPSELEMSRRHQLSEDAANTVDITWTALDRERGTAREPSIEKSVISEESALIAEKDNPSSSPIAQYSASQVQPGYNDAWEVNGEAIENAQELVNNTLRSFLQDRPMNLIRRVLCSINARQGDIAGFSIDVDGEVLRPGRTLFTTAEHPHGDHSILLIFRLRADKAITIHVLDAMAWRTTRQQRQVIHDNARMLLMNRNWWRDAFDTAEAMSQSFPKSSDWVDCIQASGPDRIDTYNVLSALALATGLELNLDFPAQAPANFHDQAQAIFEAILGDQMNWKLLHAFFITTNYAKHPTSPTGASFNTTLPPQNRRFDLRVQPFSELMAKQRAQPGATRRMLDFAHTLTSTEVNLATGKAHTAKFHSDKWEESFRDDMVRLVAVRGKWRLETTIAQVAELFGELQTKHSAAVASTGINEDDNTRISTGLSEASGMPHNTSFSEDLPATHEPGTDNLPAIPTCSQATQPQEEPSGDTIQKRVTDEQKRNSRSSLPQDFDPCSYFREHRNIILADPEAKADLEDFRVREKLTCTTKFRAWLDDSELSMCVAAVTMAITKEQKETGGFSFINAVNTAMCLELDDVELDPPAARPGRPLLLPLHIDSHYTLLIIRIVENGQVEFSVMDSKPYYLTKEGRADVHDMMYRLVKSSGWLNHWCSLEEFEAKRPKHTEWIHSSIQPSDNECGYYVLLNAWSLALGLRPDPNALLDWDDAFFRDIQDVMHLARIGRADWRLIYAFLRCSGFVEEGDVPLDRRFNATVDLRTEAHIGEESTLLNSSDDLFFAENPPLNWEQLRGTSIVNLPTGGPRHRHDATFVSDDWDDDAVNLAVELGRRGRLDTRQSAKQLQSTVKAARKDRSQQFKQSLMALGLEYSRHNRSALLQQCRDYLTGWHSRYENLLEGGPCEISKDTIHFYRDIFDCDSFGEVFRGEAFQVGRKITQKDGGKQSWKQPLDQVQVNMPISAVVEAIDRFQADTHHHNTTNGTPFAGGFSLATSVNIEFALMEGEYIGGPASRPRRCFLMPLYIGPTVEPALAAWRTKKGLKPKRPMKTKHDSSGHHLLAVMQETAATEGSGTGFELHLYDSSSHVFSDSQEFLTRAVAGAVAKLGWTKHRNGNISKRTSVTRTTVAHVPQQAKGGAWRCGPHTIINSWVLAMGLTPNPRARFHDRVYEELGILAKAAVAGLLDWRTLTAWFFCRRLTVEKSLDHVLPNRRFPTTEFWASEAALSERIEEILTEDQILESQTIAQVPYDHGNNIGHTSQESNMNEEETGSDEDYLSRRVEEVQPPFDSRINRQQPRAVEPRAPDTLEFLKGYRVVASPGSDQG